MDRSNLAKKNQEIFTVRQFVEVHPWITLGGIRSQLFHRKYNGLESIGSIIKCGTRILIDAELYIKWLRSTSHSVDKKRYSVEDMSKQ